MKFNLPVILLRGLILLPYNDIRLEFENDESKNILDVASMFHDNKILVVTTTEPLETSVGSDVLPNIGVLATIHDRIDLPNGKVRVILTGEKRIKVREYLNLNHTSEILESIVEEIIFPTYTREEESIIASKIYRELDTFVKSIPHMSNSFLGDLEGVNKLDKLTDLIVPEIPLKWDRLYNYLLEIDPKKRASMLIEDFEIEKKAFKIEKELDSKVEKELNQSQKDFILREKMRLIKEELGDNSLEDELETKIKKIENVAPERIIKRLKKEYLKYSEMQPTSPDATIVKTYMDWLLNLPWTDKVDDIKDFSEVKKSLDSTHSGLDKVKLRILEYLAVLKRTNKMSGSILCLVGPPGVGKTSLAISIANSINRDFIKLSVGGMKDESEIMGHRRTYLGARPGRVISSLAKIDSRNPVFLIDEIDKMKEGIHGDPASSLLEVLDPSQNMHFTDYYLEEEYDLSHVLFVTTANRLEDIPLPLMDRLEIIELSGYTDYEKLDVAKNHLIPNICDSHGLDKDKFKISDEVILHIIRNYTKEAGVRELKRQLEAIARKIVMDLITNNKETEYRITKKNITNYLGNIKYPMIDSNSNQVGVVNGLAYTVYGGEALSIEVNYYEGTGKVVLTGSLGDVMKESAQIALSYIKSNYKKFNIKYEILTKNDIHIHVPEGAIKKDGPSAGIALTTALISALTNKKVSNKIAMTGEITLRGKILPIGGLKEKSIGAIKNNINEVIIPELNKNDLDEIPKEIKNKIKYITVSDYMDVYKIVFKGVKNNEK